MVKKSGNYQPCVEHGSICAVGVTGKDFAGYHNQSRDSSVGRASTANTMNTKQAGSSFEAPPPVFFHNLHVFSSRKEMNKNVLTTPQEGESHTKKESVAASRILRGLALNRINYTDNLEPQKAI